MTRKTAFDREGRWRSKTVAFRVSPEEGKRIDDYVRASGLTKQEYILKRLTCTEVIVMKSPKVYYNLEKMLQELSEKLQTCADAVEEPSSYLLDTIRFVAGILDRMR